MNPQFDMSMPTRRKPTPQPLSGKVALLLAAADHVARSGGIDPHLNAAAIADSWRSAKVASFAKLSLLAGMRPQGFVVFGLFVDALDERAGRL